MGPGRPAGGRGGGEGFAGGASGEVAHRHCAFELAPHPLQDGRGDESAPHQRERVQMQIRKPNCRRADRGERLASTGAGMRFPAAATRGRAEPGHPVKRRRRGRGHFLLPPVGGEQQPGRTRPAAQARFRSQGPGFETGCAPRPATDAFNIYLCASFPSVIKRARPCSAVRKCYPPSPGPQVTT